MKKHKNIRLTRKTAVELICSTLPMPKSSIQGGEVALDVHTYAANLGSLFVCCTNDWANHNGLIRLTVEDRPIGNTIRMYFDPDTLERNFAAEEAEKEQDRLEARKDWVQRVGRERAHDFVEQCCEGV